MFKKKEFTRLGDILVNKGLITPAQLELAINEQTRRKGLLDPADITATVAPIGQILIELGFIDQLQLKRGLNWQQRLRHASIAMALCAPFMMFAPSAAANITRTAPTTIEAENYAAMKGVVSENTIDVGAGKNIGAISTGDWMSYNVDLPLAGTYRVTYRIASPYTTASLMLRSATDADLAALKIPKTGGWQIWQNAAHLVTLPKGPQTLKIFAVKGGFNINWFQLEKVMSVNEIIEAEDFSTMSGVITEPTTDVGGGENVGGVSAGDWLSYAGVNIPASGTYKITYRIASPSANGNISLRSGADVEIGAVSIPNTGGFQVWRDIVQTVSLQAGVQDLKIVAVAGGFNLNHFKIETDTGVAVASSVASMSASSVAVSAAASSTTTSTFSAPASSLASSVAAPTSSAAISSAAASAAAVSSVASSTATVSSAVSSAVAVSSIASSTPTSSAAASSAGASITSSSSVAPLSSAASSAAVPTIPTIEAETYSTMVGVITETTTDVGGGRNVGGINNGEWMSYSGINVPADGFYKVVYRVASPYNSGRISLRSAADVELGNVQITATGGFQTWGEVAHTVALKKGAQNFKIVAIAGGFNLNWFRMEFAGANTASSVNSSIAPVASSVSSSASPLSSAAQSSSLAQASSIAQASSTPQLSSVPQSSSSSPSSTPSMNSSSWSSSSLAARVAGPVAITWTAPAKRENGAQIYIEELGGYEIRYKKIGEPQYIYLSITDPWTQIYRFDWLEGEYIFQIAAFDKNGVYSPFVDIQRQ